MTLLATATLLLCAAAAPPSADGRADVARSYYEKGLVQYNLAEYDEAIRIFKEGYELTRAAGFLFNLAQAERLKGDCAAALGFYRSYLREAPEAANRNRVEERIKEMEACTALSARPPPEPLAPPSGPDLVTRAPEPWTVRPAALATLIGGAAAIGAGVYFQVQAHDAANQVSALSRAGGEWTPAYADIEHRGHRDRVLAIVCYGVGIAALGTGLTLQLMGTSGGATVAVGGALP